MSTSLRELMARVFKVDADAMPDDPDIDNIDNWDSLRHMMLMTAVESEYGVTVPLDLGPTLTSHSAIMEFLKTS